jgi:hypothetical protein
MLSKEGEEERKRSEGLPSGDLKWSDCGRGNDKGTSFQVTQALANSAEMRLVAPVQIGTRSSPEVKTYCYK